jgi:hypothetical protein
MLLTIEQAREALLQIPEEIDIERVEEAMLSMPQADVGNQHHFAPGVYIREGFIPAGTIVLGHEHKTECFNICLFGALLLRIGNEVVEIRAPKIIKTPPGVRKIAYAIEDTSWLNVLPTNETDLLRIEEQFVKKSRVFLKHESSLQLK